MRLATLTTTSGHTWTTPVNGTDESICEYFLGQWFDVEAYPSERQEMVTQCIIDGAMYRLTCYGIKRFRGFSITSDLSSERWELRVVLTVNADGSHDSCPIFEADTRDDCLSRYGLICRDNPVSLYLETRTDSGTSYAWTESALTPAP